MPRAARFIGLLVAGLLAMGQARMPGTTSASGTVAVHAQFDSHTSLRLSSSELRFEVVDPATPATATVDFTAAARTSRGGEVSLSVKRVGAVRRPESSRFAGDLTVDYAGENGAAGTLSEPGPQVVGRWIGSGVREGRISFTLRGAPEPGVYSVSVKFDLSAQ